MSLSIRAGQTVAFVGPSGGGKTTLANLISRFFDPQSGTVRVGGVDVRVFRRRTDEHGFLCVPEQPADQSFHL